MSQSVIALLFGGFVAGLLVTSRTLGWLMGLYAALRPRASATPSNSIRPWPFPLVLHSGPWLLLVVAGVVRYVAMSKPPELLWALTGGLAAAVVFIAFIRIRIPSRPPPPLTPQRLVEIRREFFVGNMALFGIVTTAIAGFSNWNTLDRDYPIVIICALFSPLSGWLYAVIMWQWYGALLEVAEKKRRQREALNSGGNDGC